MYCSFIVPPCYSTADAPPAHCRCQADQIFRYVIISNIQTSVASLQAKLLQTFMDQIHAFNSTITPCIHLQLLPTASATAFGANKHLHQLHIACKKNSLLLPHQCYIAYYSNRITLAYTSLQLKPYLQLPPTGPTLKEPPTTDWPGLRAALAPSQQHAPPVHLPPRLVGSEFVGCSVLRSARRLPATAPYFSDM